MVAAVCANCWWWNSLAAVNFFLGLVGIVQVSRIMMWRSEQKKMLAEQVGGEATKEVVQA